MSYFSLHSLSPSPLDDPKEWSSHQQRPFFDIESYQERIDGVVGRSANGRPIIRLVWAPHVTTEVFGEVAHRYWITRSRNGSGWTYNCPPRWILEQRYEKAQYAPAWNASRHSITNPATGQPMDKGDPPDEYYSFAYVCVEHARLDKKSGWPKCCQHQWNENRGRCWGEYRLPNQTDIDQIAQSVRQRDQMPWIDPYAALSTRDLYDIERMAGEQVERESIEAEEEMQAKLDYQIRQDLWMLSATEKTIKHGKTHLLGANAPGASGFKETPSGLFVPE